MDKEKTHFNTILKFGCGPNFVLNRPEMFEAMIQKQGLIFWFRFWLTFCLQPCCYDMYTVQRHWPVMTTVINIGIHKQFLEGSVTSRARYCLDRVIRPMLIISPNTKWRKAKLREHKVELRKLVTKSVGFAFGCALCDVFLKWMVAENIYKDENYSTINDKKYWTIPDEYLKSNFRPRLLEEFLVIKWKEDLLSMLGMSEEQALWIKDLLKIEDDKINIIKEMSDEIDAHIDLKLIQQTSYFMREIRNGRKKQIQDVDEATKNRIKVISNVQENKENKENNDDDNKSTTLHSKKIHQCNFCFAFESERNKFKKCKKCVEELWAEPKYYCDTNCQVSDWYQFHHDEHQMAELYV